jgi:deazaflavin-dependent oxidoreductase (nitroreductase family)
VGNPVSGYVMVVLTTGRTSGQVRTAAVVYSITGGYVYCMAGEGPLTNWYRNALANPDVTLLLPGGTFRGVATEVTDPAEKALYLREVLKNSGITAFTEGVNPWRAGDEELLRSAADKPLMRFAVADLETGPGDPGGWAWLWLPGFVLAAAVAVILSLRRRRPI